MLASDGLRLCTYTQSMIIKCDDSKLQAVRVEERARFENSL